MSDRAKDRSTPGEPSRILDAHTHYPFGPYSDEYTFGEMKRLAEKFGIRRLVVLGDVFKHGPRPDAAQIVDINDATIRLVGEYPDFVMGCCYLNPRNGPASIRDEVDRCFDEGGLRAIKLEISINCREKELDAVMEAAARRNCVVYQHAWYLSGGNGPDHSTPADVAVLAGRFPEVRIIMPHLAGWGERGVRDVAEHQNVYVDTSGGVALSGLVEYAVEVLGAGRVLYGSDFPVRDFSAQIGRVAGARITDDERRLIFHDNAAELLDFG